jgi:hypothetical protein
VLLWSALKRADVMAGALMSDERGCGRDADSNTRDVASGAAIAQLARSIKLLGGSCNVALRAAAAALRVGSDCGEGA